LKGEVEVTTTIKKRIKKSKVGSISEDGFTMIDDEEEEKEKEDEGIKYRIVFSFILCYLHGPVYYLN
jgi:hypothetical protein